jgi:hypothetical protein
VLNPTERYIYIYIYIYIYAQRRRHSDHSLNRSVASAWDKQPTSPHSQSLGDPPRDCNHALSQHEHLWPRPGVGSVCLFIFTSHRSTDRPRWPKTRQRTRHTPRRHHPVCVGGAFQKLPLQRSEQIGDKADGLRSIYPILPAALGPGAYSASDRNEYPKQKNHVSREQSAAGAWVSQIYCCRPIVGCSSSQNPLCLHGLLRGMVFSSHGEDGNELAAAVDLKLANR